MVSECGKCAEAAFLFILSIITVAVEAVERWARDRRVWSGGGQARACPRAVHTFRRTAVGPQDASTAPPLGGAAIRS